MTSSFAPVFRRAATAALTLLVGTAVAGLGQEWRGPVAIEVVVEDNRGKDVPGAEVRLVYLAPSGGGVLPSVTTDAGGKVAIGGLAAGRWMIEVRRPGLMTYRAEVALSADNRPTVLSAAQEMAPGATGTMRVKLNRSKSGTPLPVREMPPPVAPAPRATSAPPAQRPVETPAAAASPAPAPAVKPAAPVSAPPVTPVAEPVAPARPAPPVGLPTTPASAPAPATRPAPPAAAAPATAASQPNPAAPVGPPTTTPATPAPAPPAKPAASVATTPAAPVRQTQPAAPVGPPTSPAAGPAPAVKPAAPLAAPAQPAAPAPQPRPAAPSTAPVNSAPPAPAVVPTPAPLPIAPAPAAPAKPAPAPAPVVAPSASAVAAAPPAAPSPASTAPARQRVCVECAPGESAQWGEAILEGGAGAGCPADLRQQLDGVSLFGDAAFAALNAALGPGCRAIRVELPAGARFTGFRYEASGGAVTADCLPGRDCPAGGARFPFEPVLRREGGRTTLLVAFESTAAEPRTAVVAGYFSFTRK